MSDELIRKVCDLAVAGTSAPKDGGIMMWGDGPEFPGGLRIHTRYENVIRRRVWRNGWVPISTRKRNRDRFARVHAGELVIEWQGETIRGFLILGSFTPGYREVEVTSSVTGEHLRIVLPDGRVIYRPSPRA